MARIAEKTIESKTGVLEMTRLELVIIIVASQASTVQAEKGGRGVLSSPLRGLLNWGFSLGSVQLLQSAAGIEHVFFPYPTPYT